MNSTTLCVRVDESDKERFKTLADELGMNMTTVCRVLIKRFLETDGFILNRSPSNRCESANDTEEGSR